MGQLDETVRQLREIVEEYCQTRPASEDRLEVSGPFDRDALRTSPLAKKPGCYVIYGEDDARLYTGETTRGVEKRIWEHLRSKEQAGPFWKGIRATFFCFVVTPAAEAPRLEQYLIDRGHYYRVPARADG